MFYLILFTLSLGLNLSGCMSGTMMVNNHIAKKNAKLDWEASKKMRASERARFEAMKTAGDPQGYYFSAIAYALKTINSRDPEVPYEAKRSYEEAVAKGSNDAKVALGNLLIRGGTLPFGYIDSRYPIEKREFERGIRLLTEANAQSCIYKQPLIHNVYCNNERAQNTADLLYIYYRSGVYDRIDPDKPRQEIFKKDPKRAEYWKKRMDQCELEIQEYNRLHRCTR